MRKSGIIAAATDWALVLIGMGAANGFVALSVIVLARRVSSLEYGQYVSCYALGALLVVLPGLGLDSWLLLRGATTDRLGTLWQSAFRMRVRLLALWIAGLTLGGWLLLPAADFPPVLLLVTVLGLAGESISALGYSVLRNTGSHRTISVLQVLGGTTLVLGSIVLPLESGGAILFASTRAAVSGLVAAFTVSMIRNRILPAGDSLETRLLLRQARPFAFGDMAVSVYMRADLTIVSLFVGAGGASVYGPALSIVNMGFLIPSAFYALALPRLAATFDEDRARFQWLGSHQLALQAATGLALASAAFILAPWIIEWVFGSAYSLSGDVLRLLSPLLFVKCLNFGLAAYLTASLRQTWRSTIQAAAAVFNVAANVALVVPFGVAGVALVYLASEVLLALGYAAGTWRGRPAGGPQVAA